MSEAPKYRVVVETFHTQEAAIDFRNAINEGEPHKRAHIEQEIAPRDWRIWNAK